MSMSRYDSAGFSGESYDRNVFEANLSTVNKLQRDFWTARQVLRKKLGKSDDECIIASDADIDSKLELFRTVQITCADLIKAVERYQNCVCVLSRDENAMGRFLKDQGSLDKTQAGKMMGAVGKSLCYNAQQRLALRHPLGRLHHDIETFRYRAVGDSVLSVDQMEEARTHYRASLRWMQDISSNLDPEQYKKLEKFRRVQNEVRLNKDKFDRLKWAVCQKVDLLCASRSNLFSTVLVPYQDELIKFWEKTANTMSAVLENMKDYQHYEFKLLKELDTDKKSDDEKPITNENEEKTEENNDQLISLSDQEFGEGDNEKIERSLNSLNLQNGDQAESQEAPKEGDDNLLLGNVETTDFQQPTKEDLDFLKDILGEEEKAETSGDLETQWHSVFGDFTQTPSTQHANVEAQAPSSTHDSNHMQTTNSNQPVTSGYLPSQLMDFMMTSANQPSPMNQMVPGMQHQQQMMSMGYPQHQAPPPMMQPPTYQSMFGNTPMTGNYQQQNRPPMKTGQEKAPQLQSKKDQKGNMSAWFNLFAELDPLQNPDALGKKSETDNKEKPEGGAC